MKNQHSSDSDVHASEASAVQLVHEHDTDIQCLQHSHRSQRSSGGGRAQTYLETCGYAPPLTVYGKRRERLHNTLDYGMHSVV